MFQEDDPAMFDDFEEDEDIFAFISAPVIPTQRKEPSIKTTSSSKDGLCIFRVD
jgi:hypothetical protein